ncbi:hypothetical protein [Sphingomonas hengshuiensis]|uniref:hypothetical protein n=1 Tax=Sphingomonas hengshuiensis TaxID=1609977 RepID=UPI0012B88B3B|nr:hypothetical protein [Sphingomonas hengshuiensis]
MGHYLFSIHAVRARQDGRIGDIHDGVCLCGHSKPWTGNYPEEAGVFAKNFFDIKA